MTRPATSIDVRTIAPRDRHPLIFSTFAALEPGHAMELVNDHDPRPLFHQFAAQWPGQFSWDYLEAGPGIWRVAIGRVRGDRSRGQCCGACGGA